LEDSWKISNIPCQYSGNISEIFHAVWVREEINKEYTKRGGNLTYENIKELNYLDKVFKGTSFEKKN